MKNMPKKTAKKQFTEAAVQYYRSWLAAAKEDDNESLMDKMEKDHNSMLLAAEEYVELDDGIGEPVSNWSN